MVYVATLTMKKMNQKQQHPQPPADVTTWHVCP